MSQRSLGAPPLPSRTGRNGMDAATLESLERSVPGGVRTRATDRYAMAHDASHYLMIPAAVAVPRDAHEVVSLMTASRHHGLPLTFRSAGSSLSGQASTRGLLVDTRSSFRHVEVLDEGERVRVEPGATVRQVNTRLAPYGRKLGPDPASESACTVGGVVANNSSGMTCGTEFNTYRTIESLVLVLPSGTVVDTAARGADERLHALEPELYAGLLALRDRVVGNPMSVRIIEAQYAMKNTMGYGLNSFLDHRTAIDLLTHLVVGSEGTLAFIAEATFRTVPVHPHAATGLLVFPSLAAATGALPDLVAAGPAAIELLDAAALRVAQLDPAADRALRDLAVEQQTALLVEWQESDSDVLDARVADSASLLGRLPLAAGVPVSRDPAARASLWHIRKGLYAAVAGARPPGTTTLLEDVAVPVPALADACAALTALFDAHGYDDSVIFGHAKDGNLHFMLTERFGGDVEPRRYAAFTEDMVDVVLGAGGTLKAEHGTGRVMAPYVRRQFGDELHDVMRELKRLFDPSGLLNPDVLLTEDADLHLRDLKAVPVIEPEVDRCVECGYCEPVCPSRDLTTTPRQRIVLRREMAAAADRGDTELLRELQDDYGYDAVATCAVDGMCATACPVLINTGDLIKRLRAADAGSVTQAVWGTAAAHWSTTTRGLARALDAAHVLPPAVPEAVTRTSRAVLGAGTVPEWRRDLPGGGRRRVPHAATAPAAVYLPSCLGTLFAPPDGGDGVQAAVLGLAERAGIELLVPEGIDRLCCGTPWSSKGLESGYRSMQRTVVEAVHAATSGGDLPVVVDASSCTEGYVRLLADAAPAIRVVDSVDFVADTVLPRLTVRRRLSSLALHPTCSSRRLGTDDAALRVASAVAEEVVVPASWQCCAFAGDRGLLHPELTASATREEAAEVGGRTFEAYASVNRTCEIGMTRATGRSYVHLLELVCRAV